MSVEVLYKATVAVLYSCMEVSKVKLCHGYTVLRNWVEVRSSSSIIATHVRVM